MDIEWDPAKAKANLSKHGVSFSDAVAAFYDEFSLSMADDFSVAEERFVLVGRDALGRVVAVSYTYRDDAIRLISARLATKSERREYEKELRL